MDGCGGTWGPGEGPDGNQSCRACIWSPPVPPSAEPGTDKHRASARKRMRGWAHTRAVMDAFPPGFPEAAFPFAKGFPPSPRKGPSGSVVRVGDSFSSSVSYEGRRWNKATTSCDAGQCRPGAHPAFSDPNVAATSEPASGDLPRPVLLPAGDVKVTTASGHVGALAH